MHTSMFIAELFTIAKYDSKLSAIDRYIDKYIAYISNRLLLSYKEKAEILYIQWHGALGDSAKWN